MDEDDRRMSVSVRSTPIDIDCLLPNGFMLVLNEKPTKTVKVLKELAFTEAKQQPLGDLLPDADVCSVSFVHEIRGLSDVKNENIRLCDLKCIMRVLKFQEIAGSREEKKMRHDLSKSLLFF